MVTEMCLINIDNEILPSQIQIQETKLKKKVKRIPKFGKYICLESPYNITITCVHYIIRVYTKIDA